MKNEILFLWITCLLFPALLLAQKPPKPIFQSDTTAIVDDQPYTYYKKMGDSLSNVGKYSAAAYYIEKGWCKVLKENNYQKIINWGLELYLPAVIKTGKGSDCEIVKIFNFLRRHCNANNDLRCLRRYYNAYAKFLENSDPVESLLTYNKAITLGTKELDSVIMWRLHNNKGNLLLENNDLILALPEFEKALSYISSKNDNVDIIDAFISILYAIPISQKEKVNQYVNQSISICKSDPQQEGCLVLFNNVANIYIENGQLNEAKEIITQYFFPDGIEHVDFETIEYHELLHTIALLDYKTGNYKNARKNLEIVAKHAITLNDSIGILMYTQDLAKTYHKLGLHKYAFQKLEEVTNIMSQKKEKLKLSEITNRIEVKQAQNEQKDRIKILKNSNTTLQKVTIGGLALSIIVISMFIYRVSLQKIRMFQLREQATLDRMKSLQSAMNPHFLFNAFSTLQNLILTKKTKEADEYMVRLTSLIRNVFYCSDRKYIPFNKELDIIQSYVALERGRYKDLFSIQYDIDKELEKQNPLIPSMIIQPYVENAIKHGFVLSSRDNRLSISFRKTANMVRCKISDNGVGRNKAKKEQKHINTHLSIATQNTRERLEILNRTLRVKANVAIRDLLDENNQSMGTEVVITLPIKKSDYEKSN
ncbi:histidine kinase [Aquimarina sp. U1-2]|uniref:histidine kinase n=1 Tax=Aquimarina sp. U1-2 TaxID=2823141 RepID=UPI001AECD1CE|nr:histidine kinase [Aquimarina sp. U1-2]MBP2833217.1 histidine kinase [Aquimarina sp. U1-2]